MSTTDKLQQLINGCKCSVEVSVNDHRDDYSTAAQWLSSEYGQEATANLPADVKQKMIETNTIVYIHFYPDTPIGFYEIYHYDLNEALDLALETLEENRKRTIAN